MKAKRKTTLWVTLGVGAALVAAIFIPAYENAQLQGRLTTLISNGRIMYVSFLGRSLEYPPDPRSAWPQTDGTQHQSGIAHQTSTEFLKWVVTSGVINVEFSFFGGPGVAGSRSMDPDTFNADQNAWCIVADADKVRDGFPVMFTRNITVTNTSQLVGRIRDTFDDSSPLKLDGAVVQMNGGSAMSFSGDGLDMTWEEVFYSKPLGDHPVLRP